MFLSLKHREELGLKEPVVEGVEATVLPNGVTSTKDARIKKLRPKDVESSFNLNTEKEDALLKYLERFVTAFQRSHHSRKQLFIAPYNECGIPKFVCTTIRPTKMPHVEMYHAKSCAKFVAGFLEFEPLQYATEAPRYLPSPKCVLKWQVADPFDFAVVLASFLVGAGYDAYVVKGYAPKFITWRDQSKQPCPVLEGDKKPSADDEEDIGAGSGNQREAKEEEELLYPIQRPVVGVSKYEEMMQKRVKAEMRKLVEAEQELLKEEEVPEEPDPLEGQRVHAWILVVPNARPDVKEYTMIEPTTGVLYTLENAPYLGIEQIWNHKNLYVNMQGTDVTPKDLSWDFNEPETPAWLPVFDTTHDEPEDDDDDVDTDEEEERAETSRPGSPRSVGSSALPSTLPSATNSVPGSPRGELTTAVGNSQQGSAAASVMSDSEAARRAAEGEEVQKPSALSTVDIELEDGSEVMPPPWCPFLRIPQSVFNTRFGGKKHEKVVLYKRAKHEMFPKHAHAEGLTSRVTLYDDDDYTIPIETREEFCARSDKLASRVRRPLEGLTTSFFDPGRPRKLRELHEVMGRSLTMVFDPEARLDGLERREEVFGESLKEWFKNRSDKLTHRGITMVSDEGTNGVSHAFTIPAGPDGEFLIEEMVQEFGEFSCLPCFTVLCLSCPAARFVCVGSALTQPAVVARAQNATRQRSRRRTLRSECANCCLPTSRKSSSSRTTARTASSRSQKSTSRPTSRRTRSTLPPLAALRQVEERQEPALAKEETGRKAASSLSRRTLSTWQYFKQRDSATSKCGRRSAR